MAVAQREKTFSYHDPGPDGRLLPGLGGRKTVLYNLPAIAAAAPGSVVYIVEGEKDVNCLKKEGEAGDMQSGRREQGPDRRQAGQVQMARSALDDLVGFHCPVIPEMTRPAAITSPGERPGRCTARPPA